MIKNFISIIIFFKEQLECNFIEKVDTTVDDCIKRVHYIPHHAVAKESNTTPLRIVFDCSAKQNCNVPSLNECLMTGPDLSNDLVNVLLRFRIGNYAATTDI